MKTHEYREGPEAQRNFERGMKALFKVPKADIVQREKRAKRKQVASTRKTKRSDKD
jgi:hypothetical protein